MDADVQMEVMREHLLYHKAMAEDEETFHKINGYLSLLDETNGEKLSDNVDESIRAMFSLVLERGMDPWAIDIEEFVKLYSEKVANSTFDMIVAGRLLLMAWKILHMQSDVTLENATPVEEYEEPIEETFDFVDEDPILVPDVSLTKTVIRVQPRTMTMVDILDALEDANAEAEAFQAKEAARLAAVEERKKNKASTVFDNKAHKEDDETVVERMYQRIYSMGMDPMPLSEFYTASKEENISVFVSCLHLMRNGRLEITQETLPYGEIMVQIKLPEAAVPLEEAAVN